jgi:hypothetical protein
VHPARTSSLFVKFRVPDRSGIASHFVAFSTNDPDRRHVRLTFRADAHWPITVNPPAVHIPVLLQGDTLTRVLELSSFDGQPFIIDAAATSVAFVSVNITPNVATHRHSAQVTVFGESPVEAFDAAIRFQIKGCPHNVDTVTVPISGSIVSKDYRIAPRRLSLGMQAAGAEVTKKIIVYAENPPGLDSIDVVSDSWKVLNWTIEGPTISVALRVPNMGGYNETSLLVRVRERANPLELAVSCLVAGHVAEQDGDQP